ncbi:unnamed protein product [Sphagnum balticum]
MRSVMHNETNKRLTDVRCSSHTKSTASWSIIGDEQRLNGSRIKVVRLHGKLRGLEGQMAFLVFAIDHALNGHRKKRRRHMQPKLPPELLFGHYYQREDVKHP